MTTKQTAETKVTAENIDALRCDLERSRARHKMCQDGLTSACKERDVLADRCRELEGERDEERSLNAVWEQTVERVTNERDTALQRIKALEGMLGEACGLIDELTEDTPQRAHAIRGRELRQEADRE